MSHSNAFVNVLLQAMDSEDLRNALAEDTPQALKDLDVGGSLSDGEVSELKEIFEQGDVSGQANQTMACPYRGF